MARILLTLSKMILFTGLLFVRFKEKEWARILEPLGELVAVGAKFTSLTNILLNFIILALGLNLSLILFSAIYRRRQRLPRGRTDNVLAGLENIYILLMTAAVIIAILSLFGIDTKSLFTGLSIVAAAIAIVTRDYIVNIISGIAISFSDEISIGDHVKIGDYKGRVTDITISRIALENDDDDIIFILNNTVYTSEIVNYTKKGIRKVNIEFELNLEFLETIEALEEDLIDCLQDYHEHIEPGSFRLRIIEIHKDSLELKFQYTLKRIDRELEKEIRRKTVRRVVNHLRRDAEEGGK
ncbi:MAG: mechanosensitive ion channel [Saprospiraceae bacterium]